jgi:hypothetical protein
MPPAAMRLFHDGQRRTNGPRERAMGFDIGSPIVKFLYRSGLFADRALSDVGTVAAVPIFDPGAAIRAHPRGQWHRNHSSEALRGSTPPQR